VGRLANRRRHPCAGPLPPPRSRAAEQVMSRGLFVIRDRAYDLTFGAKTVYLWRAGPHAPSCVEGRIGVAAATCGSCAHGG